jgi:hypothetical protein
MDEETRAEFTATREENRAEFAAIREENRVEFAAIRGENHATFNALLKLMNDQHERLIDQIKSLSHDFQNTKGFLMR